MNRDSSIIPKIIVILGFLSVVGIILLFFLPRSNNPKKAQRPDTPEKLFAQVIMAAQPQVQKLWEEGDRFIKKADLKCPSDITFDTRVGRSYYQCQPHFWQCFWNGGLETNPSLKIDIFGQEFHVRAKPSFKPVPQYSPEPRFYEILKGPFEGLDFHYGMLVELTVEEIPNMTWPVVLTNSCRDTYLPERIYAQGKVPTDKKENFEWDNFSRNIFIDKFYVSNQEVNEWRILTGKPIITDRNEWPKPALLSLAEQHQYCTYWGKRLLEAKLFDAATMTPIDQKEPTPIKVARPQTPWQRDIGKTFLGMSRINPDYQLTPLDCQLAQVEGCQERFYSTDSVSWMGMNFALGFYPESLHNNLEADKNLKRSSRFLPASSPLHELGILGKWNGEVSVELPVAFRCYEEVSL